MLNYIRVAACVGLLGVGLYAGSLWGSKEVAQLKTQHAQDSQNNADMLRIKQRELDATRDRETARMAAIDKQQTEQLRKEREETERLRACIADGSCGLRVIGAKCPASGIGVPQAGAGSRVDIGTVPTVDTAVGQNYFALRQAITDTERKLDACQQILRGQQ